MWGGGWEGSTLTKEQIIKTLIMQIARKLQKHISKNKIIYGHGKRKYEFENIEGLPIRGNLLTNYDIPVIVYEQLNGDRVFTAGESVVAVVSQEAEEEIALW